MRKRKQISLRQARLIGDCLYLDWEQVDLEQFRQGLMGYHRLAGTSPQAVKSYPEVLLAAQAVMEHMQQVPDYFVRLARLRAEVKAFPGRREKPARRQSA